MRITTLLLLAAVACKRPPVRSNRELREIYAAALADSGQQSAGQDVALGLELMSDDGHYVTSGYLPDSVVQFLLARGLVSEICGADSQPPMPRCLSHHAHIERRLSHVVPLGGDTVMVIVSGSTIQPIGEPSSNFPGFAAAYDVLLVFRDGRWQVVARRLGMIT